MNEKISLNDVLEVITSRVKMAYLFSFMKQLTTVVLEAGLEFFLGNFPKILLKKWW